VNVQITNNRIHNVMNMMADGAGIYTYWMTKSRTLITGNYVSNVRRSGFGGAWPQAAVYLDEGTDYVTLNNNVLADSSELIHRNWSQFPSASLHNSLGYNPTADAAIQANAGIQSAYRDIKALGPAPLPSPLPSPAPAPAPAPVPAPTPTALVSPTITAPSNGATVGTSMTISWNSTGAAGYLLRCQDLTGSTPFDSRNTWNGQGFLYIDMYRSTSIAVSLVAGHRYNFWIHSATSSTNYSFSSSAVTFTAGSSTSPTPTTQSSYKGSPWSIPGNISPVQYDNGGEGVAYHDLTPANFWSSTYRPGHGVDSDGVSIGWMNTGEWLEYTVNVSTAGSYTLTVPVSNTGTGGKISVSMNGVDVTGILTVPTTGGWNTYQNLSKTVNLSAGAQVMRISVVSNSSTGGATNLRNSVVFLAIPIGAG
jgi:hypothetical protein